MTNEDIVQTVLRFYPEVEAVYLFGSYGTEDEWPESDVDIALLLPPDQAKSVKNLALSDCNMTLMNLLHKDIDLVNLRMVNTVFQHEIIQKGKVIFRKDENTVDLFEMTVMSAYQKLNEERAEILQEIYRSGRILNL